MLPARRAPAGVRQTAVPAGAFARPGKALPRRLLPGRIVVLGAPGVVTMLLLRVLLLF